MYVYKIINESTGDFYIGKTIRQLEARFKQHQYDAKSGSDTHLHRAMRKHGFDNFKIVLIEQVDGDLDQREIHWISEMQPKYNMTSGGEGGDTSKSEKYQQYMKLHSEFMMGRNNPFYGRSHSEETKRKISEKKTGSRLSEETKRKIGDSARGRKMPREVVERQRAQRSKTYRLINPEGEYIIVTNLSQFCRDNNLDQGNMNAMYAGKYKTCKGYSKQ